LVLLSQPTRLQARRSRNLASTALVAAPSVAATSHSSDSSTDEANLTRLGFIKWKELTVGKSKIKLYGFLRLDAIYDDSCPNNTQIPAFIRSEDPTAPAPIMSEHNSEDFTLQPRLTRFGIDFEGPELSGLGKPEPTGKLEIDFYNMPSSESRLTDRRCCSKRI
jgi:hypothetical protein